MNAMKQRLYDLTIPIYGLTGGIGTGKSTASLILERTGFPVICADSLVKKIYKDRGVENQSILREKFFNDPKFKSETEKWIQEELPHYFKEEFEKLKPSKFVIYDIPLLFERNLEDKFDKIILIYAPRNIQLKRASLRDKNDPSLIEKILDSQIDIEEKRSKSHYVVENLGTVHELEAKLLNLDLFKTL